MLPFEVKSVLEKKKKNRKKKEEKNINKLKLCLQTDLCLKG